MTPDREAEAETRRHERLRERLKGARCELCLFWMEPEPLGDHAKQSAEVMLYAARLERWGTCAAEPQPRDVRPSYRCGRFIAAEVPRG